MTADPTASHAPQPPIDPRLRELLRCPACHAALDDVSGTGDARGATGPALRCTACGLTYPVRDGVPILLVDEAQPAS